MFHSDVIDLGTIDVDIYKCIAEEIDTDRVIVSEKQLEHISEHHPDAYSETLIQLKSTLQDPDYIFLDERREFTGLVVLFYGYAPILKMTSLQIQLFQAGKSAIHAFRTISVTSISFTENQNPIKLKVQNQKHQRW